MARIEWRNYSTTETDVFSMKLSDGTSVKAGTKATSSSHAFREQDKITRVEVYYKPDSEWIEGIVFYEDAKVLVDTMPEGGKKGGKDTFEIGPNERLIGCELDHNDYSGFFGITFVKWTIA